eukprot:295148-Chlamydomonas_euryale.AAC.3
MPLTVFDPGHSVRGTREHEVSGRHREAVAHVRQQAFDGVDHVAGVAVLPHLAVHTAQELKVLQVLQDAAATAHVHACVGLQGVWDRIPGRRARLACTVRGRGGVGGVGSGVCLKRSRWLGVRVQRRRVLRSVESCSVCGCMNGAGGVDGGHVECLPRPAHTRCCCLESRTGLQAVPGA